MLFLMMLVIAGCGGGDKKSASDGKTPKDTLVVGLPLDLASIDPAAFYDPFHADVYRAIQRLCSKGHPVEPVAVHVELRAHGVEAELDDISGLASFAAGPASMRMYAGTVADCHRLRQLLQAGGIFLAADAFGAGAGFGLQRLA